MPKKPKMKEDEVQKWFRDIDLSLEWRKPQIAIWDRLQDYLEGLYFSSESDSDRISVNMVRPHVGVVIPAIYARNPDVIVKPMPRNFRLDEVLRKRAEVMQNVLRYYMKKVGLKEEVKLCILDAIMTGGAWVKTGYETMFDPFVDEASIQQRKKDESLISKILTGLGIKEAAVEDEDDDTFPFNSKVIKERPWVLRVSPRNMIVPALSSRTNELYWIGERLLVPHEQVMNNKEFYTNGLAPSSNAKDILAKMRGGMYKGTQYGEHCDYDVLYEIYDGYEDRIITLAEGFPVPLQVKDSEYTFLDSGHHPYIDLRFNEVPDKYYPQSDIQPAEPQILELNEARTQINTHRKRYNRKYVTQSGAFSPEDKAQLTLGDDGIVIEISPSYQDKPIDTIIVPIIDAPLPPEVYSTVQSVQSDLFTILGTNDYTNIASGGVLTATEANIKATQGRLRVEERIDLIGTFVERIIRNMAMMLQYFQDTQQISKIVGDDGVYWIQIQDHDLLQGEFEFAVAYASSAATSKELELEQFMKFYMTINGDPYFEQVKAKLELVRKFNLENPEAWLNREIAEILDAQRMQLAKSGALSQTSEDASGSTQGPGQTGTQGAVRKLPTGQPEGLPGDLGSVPGGRGGTALAGGY